MKVRGARLMGTVQALNQLVGSPIIFCTDTASLGTISVAFWLNFQTKSRPFLISPPANLSRWKIECHFSRGRACRLHSEQFMKRCWLFPRLRGFGENVRPFIFRLVFVVVVLMEIRSRILIPLFTPGSVHSNSASWDDCGRVFPGELRVSSFPCYVPTLCQIYI